MAALYSVISLLGQGVGLVPAAGDNTGSLQVFGSLDPAPKWSFTALAFAEFIISEVDSATNKTLYLKDEGSNVVVTPQQGANFTLERVKVDTYRIRADFGYLTLTNIGEPVTIAPLGATGNDDNQIFQIDQLV